MIPKQIEKSKWPTYDKSLIQKSWPQNKSKNRWVTYLRIKWRWSFGRKNVEILEPPKTGSAPASPPSPFGRTPPAWRSSVFGGSKISTFFLPKLQRHFILLTLFQKNSKPSQCDLKNTFQYSFVMHCAIIKGVHWNRLLLPFTGGQECFCQRTNSLNHQGKWRERGQRPSAKFWGDTI